MTEKSVEQMARDTLNALIAGQHIRASPIKNTAEGLKLDQRALREIELQLREYYSIDLEEKKADYSAGLKALSSD